MPATMWSKRYAQAAFEIAQEKDELEEWQADLSKIAEAAEDAEFVSLLENPKPPFELKAKLLKEKLGEINPLASNLAYLLVLKNRFRNAGQVAEAYERLLDDYHGIKHAEIVTATPLDDTDKEKLAHRIESITGRKISVTAQTDPDIIGGIITRIDGTLIDGSIRNKLELLKKELIETGK